MIASVSSGSCIQQIDASGQVGEASIPLCVEQSLEVAGDGGGVATASWEPIGSDSVRFDLVWLESGGKVLWKWSRRSPWVLPSALARDSAIAAAIRSVPIPSVKLAMKNKLQAASHQPPFRRIIIGANREVWAEQAAGASGPTWDVIRSAAGPLGQVILPKGFNLRAAGAGILICTVPDENGFENVVALRLLGRH